MGLQEKINILRYKCMKRIDELDEELNIRKDNINRTRELINERKAKNKKKIGEEEH